jgi:hypothetical protein
MTRGTKRPQKSDADKIAELLARAKASRLRREKRGLVVLNAKTTASWRSN